MKKLMSLVAAALLVNTAQVEPSYAASRKVCLANFASTVTRTECKIQCARGKVKTRNCARTCRKGNCVRSKNGNYYIIK